MKNEYELKVPSKKKKIVLHCMRTFLLGQVDAATIDAA